MLKRLSFICKGPVTLQKTKQLSELKAVSLENFLFTLPLEILLLLFFTCKVFLNSPQCDDERIGRDFENCTDENHSWKDSNNNNNNKQNPLKLIYYKVHVRII